MDAAAIFNGTTLNPRQHAAATFGNGPLLIIAGTMKLAGEVRGKITAMWK